VTVPEPRISVAIMTHPRRLDSARQLRDQHPELDPRIVVDPEPDGPPSPLRTAALAWAAVGDDATHHLVLQDDVLLCPGFREQLLAAVRARPKAALSFFTHWASHLSHAVRVAALCGFTWTEVVGKYVPTLALAAPALVARDMASALSVADTTKDDVAVRQYLYKSGVEAYVAVAGLVEHLDLPSLTGHDEYRPLRSACFADPPRRGWDARTLRPGVLPYRDESTGTAVCFRQSRQPTELGPHFPIGTELRRYGTTAKTALDSVTAAFPDGAPVPLPPLADLWSCAFLLGVCAAENSPASASVALGRPLARTGLSTLIQGMLRKDADEQTLADPRLTALVRSAVRHGWASARRLAQSTS
jgi:hypothetical protein